MLPQLKDQNALEQCQVTISEAQRRLEFLEGEFKRMTAKKKRGGSVDMLAYATANSNETASLSDSMEGTTTGSSTSSNATSSHNGTMNNTIREAPAFMQRATALFRSTHQLSSPSPVRRSGMSDATSSQPNLASTSNMVGSTNQLHSGAGSTTTSNTNMFSSFLSNLGLNKSSVVTPRAGSIIGSIDNLGPPPVSTPVKVLSSFGESARVAFNTLRAPA